MATLTFDTLKFANRLKAAGVPPQQAEAQAEAFAEATAAFDVATRADLRELEARIDARLLDVKADIIKWLAGLLIAQAAVVAALVKLL